MALATEEYPTADKLVEKINSPVKMERDSGLAMLSRLVKSVNCDEGEKKHLMKQMRSQIATTLAELGNKESVTSGQFADKKHGSLSASLILINGSPEADEEQTHQFVLQIKPDVLNLLWDQDVRVRLIAGELYGQICKILGPSAYLDSKSAIMELLETEFQRNRQIEGMVKSPETPIDPTGEIAASEPHTSISPLLGPSPVSTPMNPNFALSEVLKEAASVLQAGYFGTAGPIDMAMNIGCAQLESTLKCLQFIAKGLDRQFGPLVDQHLLDIIFPALHHHNRFIREAGFFLCATLVESGVDLKSMGKRIAEEITTGLSDFCGQARIAAAVACRRFMLTVTTQERLEFLPIMLPKLCLPRYYMADTKFLLYSQESWKLIFGTDGPLLVSKYIDDVTSYYAEAAASDNHAVREAACACLGELSRKIDRAIIAPYAAGLLETLRRSFQDERWHVRDAACLAAGSMFANYPSECQGLLDSMYPMMFENLQFPISTVRQGAASALSNTVRGYGNDVILRIIQKIAEGLNAIENQPSESCRNSDTPGISPELKYSYPPSQGAGYIPYARPSHPWELCDGCLFLIGDIAQLPECQSELPILIPKILRVTQFRSYLQHVIILETVCKILPLLIKGVGKRPFKEYLSQFFDPIFYSIECENSSTVGAARVCLNELCSIYGPNIIRSRIELYEPRFAHYVEN